MDHEVTMPSSVAVTVSGTARRVGLQSGPANANIKTIAGEVSGIALGRGSYTVATKAGKVDLTFASPPTLVNVNTTTGEVNVTVPGNASYRVKASAPIGDKKVAVPGNATAANVIDFQRDTRHHLRPQDLARTIYRSSARRRSAHFKTAPPTYVRVGTLSSGTTSIRPLRSRTAWPASFSELPSPGRSSARVLTRQPANEHTESTRG